ncbi:arginyltransferase [Thermodesulfobacteriota bacterium]
MFLFDEETRLDPSLFLDELDKYFLDVPTECPYGLPHVAVYHQARFDTLSNQVFHMLLDAGFRRNGNCFYSMRCKSCDACIPIRLNPGEYFPNRNQKRVRKANEDVEIELGPLSMCRENLELLNRFLDVRFPGRGNSSDGYYAGFFINTFGKTLEMRYRVGGRLIGVGIVDVSGEFANAVYFYFDPDEGRRSPGTLNILSLIDLCKEQEVSNLYLGYVIRSVRSMSYKFAFRPHFLLRKGQWIRKTGRET